MSEESLAVKYIEYMDKDKADRGETFDDFFNWADVPKKNRSDFAVAAILKQAKEILWT
jgi:hypothetical protein